MDETKKKPSAPAAEGKKEESTKAGVPSAGGYVADGITEEDLKKASETLNKYKEGKSSLEKRVIDNEKWYRLRQWKTMENSTPPGNTKPAVEPTSAWLFNCISNKHADAMDAYPSANILPREETDVEEAKKLSSIVPVVLDQCDFEEVYSACWDDKLTGGTGIYGVFWDSSKLNGLGDISIHPIDILNLFWEPGIEDIQKSRNVFHVELRDNDLLKEEYPDLAAQLEAGGSSIQIAEYEHDDTIDTSEKSLVVDWYYKRKVEDGRIVLHYCKFVGSVILFASENDPAYAESGWYAHGQYPFIFDPLFNIKGSPAGMGYVDIGKSCQEWIDRANSAFMKNLEVNAKPRYFVKEQGDLNEDEFADTNRELVHISSGNPKDSVEPVQSKLLNNIYLLLQQDKINELKETTGNRDVSNGGSTGGVTAASAIAAMQEAGSKLSRDASKAAYRRFKKLVLMVIELIRQFYDMPRVFRITGDSGEAEYTSFDNGNMLSQPQEAVAGEDMGYRFPLYDVEITAQKASPYTKIAQNELALQLYQAGIFQPGNEQQALALLDMMDFDGKDRVIRKITESAQNFAMAQAQMGMGMGGVPPMMPPAGAAPPSGPAPDLDKIPGESSVTADARTRTAESTNPV